MILETLNSDTDCGSDVQKVARDTNIFSFPCLCHIINLIVKQLIVNEYDTTDDSDGEIDEADDINISTSFKYVIAKVRYVVKEVTSKPTLANRLRNAQNITAVSMDIPTRNPVTRVSRIASSNQQDLIF